MLALFFQPFTYRKYYEMKVVLGFCILSVAFARQEKCQANQTFNSCGALCPLTCDNYKNPPEICGLACVLGCQCNEGYVRTKDERCVKPEECSTKTKPVNEVDKYCLTKKDSGRCKGSFLRWYYNVDTGSCQMFMYGGCRGNRNRYNTKQECLDRCKGVKSSRSKSGVCKLYADSGICKGYFPRFYFDATLRQCKKFIYGGCGGNGNNFRTLEECEGTCSKPGMLSQRRID